MCVKTFVFETEVVAMVNDFDYVLVVVVIIDDLV